MKNLTFLLTLIVLFSCKQKKEPDNSIDLTAITEPSEPNLSELGAEVMYIQLETNESCIIQQIDKLIYESGTFFILGSINPYVESPDKDAPPPPPMMPKRSVYRFSKTGEFICQIGQLGKGPSEYRYIHEFLYNRSNNTINIYFLNEIKEFSLDGVWEKNITIDSDEVISLGYTNNQFLGFIDNSAGQNEYSFVLIDANGKVLNRFENKYKFSISKNAIIYPSECIFYQYNGILHCKEMHSDTIFSFDNGIFIPKYILKQGEAKYTPDLRKEYIFENNNRDKIIIQKNSFESENYLFFQYRLKDRGNCFIQNKSDGTRYLVNNDTGLVNDMDNGPNLKIQNTLTVDGVEYLVSWINAFELKAHVTSEAFKNSTPKYPEKKKELEQLANGLDENDNPVLMLVKLKE